MRASSIGSELIRRSRSSVSVLWQRSTAVARQLPALPARWLIPRHASGLLQQGGPVLGKKLRTIVELASAAAGVLKVARPRPGLHLRTHGEPTASAATLSVAAAFASRSVTKDSSSAIASLKISTWSRNSFLDAGDHRASFFLERIVGGFAGPAARDAGNSVESRRAGRWRLAKKPWSSIATFSTGTPSCAISDLTSGRVVPRRQDEMEYRHDVDGDRLQRADPLRRLRVAHGPDLVDGNTGAGLPGGACTRSAKQERHG